MQLCPHCGQSNMEGVVFCQKCGIALVAVPLATRQLIGGDVQGGTDELSSESVVMLQFNAQEAPLTVQVKHEVILGRITEQAEETTYINLTAFGGEEQGVSRRHARLLRDNKALYLMDLNSTNGTRLNGEVLPAAVEKRLRDGDEITLGKLKLFVYFKI
ncbi:MAG TPA: FHA domain-containing protein [Aggregatilineaceae bacterium]|nr:FHA domain-containing protein [Aggregatilineaceae bacterium]